jgi:signal transduction histidine kinase
MIKTMNQGYFAPILSLSSYKHLLYFVSSWVLVLFYPIAVLLITLLTMASFGTFIGFLVPAAWIMLQILNAERFRANVLLEARIVLAPAMPQKNKSVWIKEQFFSMVTARGLAFLLLNIFFSGATLILLGAMLYLTGLLLFAPIIATWQPAPNNFSYWRDSLLWTGSEGLKFSGLSAVIAFLAGIPMLNLTLQFSDFLARVWRIAAENALSSDVGSQRIVQALEIAGKSVLESSTQTAIQTILEQGLSASSATGASIGETRINLEPSELENPKNHLLRVPLEQKVELLALYKNAPPNPRDTNLWNALGIHASTALKLQNLLTRERATASEQERQRIARELHDSVAQALYGIALGTRSALEQLESSPENARKSLEYAIDLADGGTAEMKTLLFALRPDALEEGGLAAALQKLGEMLLSRYKLKAIVTAPLEPSVSLEVKGTLYRIAQEAVHNTVKHAKAKEIQIRLESNFLEITDNGHGFELAVARAGALGIKSMRERAEGIGAVLEISSSSAGTRIAVNFGGAK